MIKYTRYPSDMLKKEEIISLYEKIEQNDYDLKTEAIAYCKNDCFVLHKIIEYFQAETVALYKIKDKRHVFDIIPNLTTPQMSLNVFRKMFQDSKFNLTVPTNTKEIEYIRGSYRGALCEVYVPETPKGYLTMEFDYVSKYAEVMSTQAFPTGEGKYVKDLFFDNGKIYFFDEDKKCYCEFFGFANSIVEVPKSLNTPYLYLHTANRGNVAPTGTFSSLWPSTDILYANSIGTKILKIKDGFHYDKTFGIYEDYVNFHFPLRLANKNNPKGKMTKLMLNSLYGKTGQKLFNRISMSVTEKQFYIVSQIMENVKIHVELPEIKMYYVSFDKSVNLKNITNIIKDEDFSKLIINTYNKFAKMEQQWRNNSLPHIAAFITAYARQDIHRLGMQIKYGTWHAADTDAVHVSFNMEDPNQKAEFEYFKSLCGENIGQLKHEGTFYHVKFFAPKVYARYDEEGRLLPELSRFKGVEAKYRELLFNNMTSEGVSIEYEQIIKRDMKHLSHNVKKVTQKFTFDWNKRILTEGGKNSRPLHYPDDFLPEERIF